MNPTEATLPRWQRPYVTEDRLIHYVAALEAGALEVARELARGFGVGVESYLLARSCQWLRRSRHVHLNDPHWERFEVPGARVPWRRDSPD